MIMMKLLFSSSLALSFVLLVPTSAQFTCTLKGAASEEVCVGTLDDTGAHCVWCSIGFSLCVDETTAESIEQSIPNAQCDRYSGSDDDDKKPATDDATPAADDQAPATDDKPAPPSDDKIKPTDDTIPDNYWECLQQKDLKTCLADNCTWCNSKAGFSLCVGGPTAEFAKKSDFYKCVDNNSTTETNAVATDFTTNFLRASASASTTASQTSMDPYDMSCITAYLNDPTETGCTSAKDQEGQACEWCSMAGMANLCLTEEQAAVAGGMGVQCDAGGVAAAAPETAAAMEAAIL